MANGKVSVLRYIRYKWPELIVCLFVGLLVFLIITCVCLEISLAMTDSVAVKCHLISTQYTPSSNSIGHGCIVGADGKLANGFVHSYSAEKTSTVWMCGPYGRLATENKEVFRYGKDESLLYIKSNFYDTRIVGIKKP